MKPNGLNIQATEGSVRFSVGTPSKAEDAVWDAVEAAINAGWSPQRFKDEASEAWRVSLHDEAKHAVKVLSR